MKASKLPILSVKNLTIALGKERTLVVKDASFNIQEGATAALVGNSGSGKSITAHAIMGLLPREAKPSVQGSIVYRGSELLGTSDNNYRDVRGKEIAMVFQEALAALNPTMKIGKQVLEAVREGSWLSRKEAKARVIELLGYVGIPYPEFAYEQYPHELSGGMRQRVVIAIALANEPNLLIADEATTALDVTIEAQVFALLRRIQREKKMSILLITHDLSIVAGFCDTVYVMQEGVVVDSGSVEDIFYRSRHPYTVSLLESVRKFRGSYVRD